MRFLLFLFLIPLTLSQLDQHLVLRYETFTRMFIVSAAIFDENQPLRVELVGPGSPNFIETIGIDRNIPLDNVLIEVMHPEIFNYFPILRSLDFEFVRMRRIGMNSFRNCPSTLRNLWWRGNFLQEVPRQVFNHCTNLTDIVFASNHITRIDPDAFVGQNVGWLTVNDNRLTEITPEILRNIPGIVTFNVHSNPVTTISPDSFPVDIQHLFLNNLLITEIRPDMFRGLTRLTTLYLNNNPITHLPPGVFQDLHTLRGLYLESTRIQRININSFGNHPLMFAIHIHFSALNEIEPGFFDIFPDFREFDGRRNLCLDQRITDMRVINVNETFGSCFENW